MSAKLILTVMLVAFCATLLPETVEANNVWAANTDICGIKRIIHTSWVCDECCPNMGYTKSEYKGRICTCLKKTTVKVRDTDEIREYSGVFGSKYEVVQKPVFPEEEQN